MKTKSAIKRPWLIGETFIAAIDEREAKRIYRREIDPDARQLEASLYEGPYMICQGEDDPEYETDEQGFVDMLQCHGGYWCV